MSVNNHKFISLKLEVQYIIDGSTCLHGFRPL